LSRILKKKDRLLKNIGKKVNLHLKNIGKKVNPHQKSTCQARNFPLNHLQARNHPLNHLQVRNHPQNHRPHNQHNPHRHLAAEAALSQLTCLLPTYTPGKNLKDSSMSASQTTVQTL